MTEPADINVMIHNRIEEARDAKFNADTEGAQRLLDIALELAGDSIWKLKRETQIEIVKVKREFHLDLTVNERVAAIRWRVPLTSPVQARPVFPQENNNH